MADKMTLVQAVEEMRDCLAEDHISQRGVVGAHNVVCWIDAIDAHIAAMGEPVAWMTKSGRVINVETRERVLANAELGGEYVVAAKAAESYKIPLYTAPPASGDWDKVREVIAEMRSGLQLPGENCSTAYVCEWVDKLTAALPENGK